MEKIKEILKNLYKRVNPDNIDYSLNENQDVNKIREIIDALDEEAEKYQQILDDLVIKENNVDSYINQYICISNEDDFIYMYVNKIDKDNCSVWFYGPGFESYSSSWMYIFPERSEEIFYENMKTKLRIITKEEFYKQFDNAITSSKESLEREFSGF